MSTPYDWVTVALFAGLAVIFLQRSVGERPADDRIINYIPPAVACAAANHFGNHGHDAIAIALIIAMLGYSWYVIRPFQRG